MSFNKQNINGILLLNKSIGFTSNSALQKIKRLYQAKKAGHTGSLDPLATGMLPICFGEATKFSQFLLDSDKQYAVTMKLGVKTTTGDAEGEIIDERIVKNITAADFEKVAEKFLGPIQQIPPMFSAIKVDGKPLYELARKGIEIERQSREVDIHKLQLISTEITDTAVFFSFNVHCSKGTYVRTLVEDMGAELGYGAHVTQLHRVAVMPYQDKPMYSMPELEKILAEEGMPGLQRLLLPVESSVGTLPAVSLSTAAAFYLRTGQAVLLPHSPTEGLVRMFSDSGIFMGVGAILDDGRVTPRRLVTA